MPGTISPIFRVPFRESYGATRCVVKVGVIPPTFGPVSRLYGIFVAFVGQTDQIDHDLDHDQDYLRTDRSGRSRPRSCRSYPAVKICCPRSVQYRSNPGNVSYVDLCRWYGSHLATWARSYRPGVDLSSLKVLDHTDHTDHTDHLSDAWIVHRVNRTQFS